MLLLFLVAFTSSFSYGAGQIVDLRTGRDIAKAIVREFTHKFVLDDPHQVSLQPWVGYFLPPNEVYSQCVFSDVVINGLTNRNASFKTIFENHVHTFKGVYTFPSAKIKGNIDCSPKTGLTHSKGTFSVSTKNIKWFINIDMDFQKMKLAAILTTFKATGASRVTLVMNNSSYKVAIEEMLEDLLVETLNDLVRDAEMCVNNKYNVPCKRLF